MPNAIEELNKLIQRLEMLFQVQTHEVVQDLKRIRDIIETPVVDEPQEEIKQDKQHKLEKVADTTETTTPIITESKEDIVKRYIEKFNKKPFA
jgi:ElaB/YqjD/DUF883 family membrane-anchored ribosome-binding protein